jgi:hypothetical protein
MRNSIFSVVAITFLAATLSGCTRGPRNGRISKTPGDNLPKKALIPFASDQELANHLREFADEQKREWERRRSSDAPAVKMEAAQALSSYAGEAKEGESVTNVQHAGVDEGGIVKLHGDHLVMLRRGRLFTVAIGDNALTPISAVDAFGQDIDPRGTWYDEMLVSEDNVVVIGYSYQRGGTEIGLFNIDRAGNLSHRETYHLRSNDYYSSRNYSSRLIGNKLIFYTPLYLSPGNEDPFKSFPALRKWHKGATADEFQRIAPATRIYRPQHRPSVLGGLALHTVTVCDLSNGELSSEATAVLGPPGRVFYVSSGSVYVWVSSWSHKKKKQHQTSMLYRMPLDGSAPSALGVSGTPVDQFSFLESEDGYLNVLVRSDASGDAMWAPEAAAGDVALMRVALDSFSDGSEAVPSSSYTTLPEPGGYTFQNRFVGDYLLYGTGSGWGRPDQTSRSILYAVRYAGGDPVELPLEHGTDRIEAMGSDAVAVGTDGNDLHFTGIRLGDQPVVASRYTRKNASQGELRSHGFFYKAEGSGGGLLGLPIRGSGRPGYEHLIDDSASILFLRNDSLRLNELGELPSRAKGSSDDNCRASCVDWYGNARPLFVRGRVFALLGYELVEGALAEGRIRETRRISYAAGRQISAR